jgi:hypothetical protein
MSDFNLIHVETSGGLTPPTYEIAVAIGQSGKGYEWTDAQVIGHTCVASKEWDDMIDRLVKSLEKVRREGHIKLQKNR